MDVEHRHQVVAACVTAGAICAACHLVLRHYTSRPALTYQGQHCAPWSGQQASDQAQQLHGRSSLALQGQRLAAPVQYDWAQSIEEVLIEMQLPARTRAQDLDIQIRDTHLSVSVRKQCVIDGQLAGQIQRQGSGWQIENIGSCQMLSITLCKSQSVGASGRYAVWDSLLLPGTDTHALSDQLPDEQQQCQLAQGAAMAS